MNRTGRILIGGVAVCLLAAAWALWSEKARETTGREAPAPAPLAMTKGDEQRTMSPASPKSSMQENTQTSPTTDLEQRQLQRELERLADTQQYRDMLGRQERGEQLTKDDLELLLMASDIKGKMIKEPDIEKSTAYPPVDAKTLEMWQWWHKMKEADPNFEYKRPIEFYGKVVDDAGKPIQGATVGISISGPDGDKAIKLESDSSGQFKIVGKKGKRIRVGVGKRGYSSSAQSSGFFEFAEFFSETFYEPDPSKPVVFVLPRLKP